jgi:pyruvate dehydrogenase E1 component alpha subunit
MGQGTEIEVMSMLFGGFDPLKGEMYQVLDPDGNLVVEDPNLDEALLREMYKWMIFGRLADEKAVKLQRQGRMGTYAPGKGQEASQVGPALAMKEQDWLFPSFRELTSYMIRGYPLEYNLEYFMGDVRSNQVPEGTKSLPIFVPVATQVPIAAGAAWALKRKGNDSVVVCYMGDGATSEGDFHEGLNFAGVFGSPALFISQNNQWAISVPRKKQTASRTIAQKALSYGIPGMLVDGNDVLAMYAAATEGIERARKGEGPFFIEAYTYRRMMHTTADDPTRYRTAEEEAEWEMKDPISRFRSYLERKGIWTMEWQKDLEGQAEDMIRRAVEVAESLPPNEPEDLFRYVYAEMTPALGEQLEYLRYSIDHREIEEEASEIKGGFP